MRAQNWTDVITLLAVMVASKKMERRDELSTFKQAAHDLRDKFAPNIMLTDSFAVDWLTTNKSKIDRQTSSVHFDTSVKDLRKNLDSLANKSEILTMIMKWTLSDTPLPAKSRQAQVEPKEWTYTKPSIAIAV